MYKILPYLLLLLIPSSPMANQNEPQFYIELNFFEVEGDFQEFVDQNASELIQNYMSSSDENPAYLFNQSITEMDEGKWSGANPPIYDGQHLSLKIIASPRLLVRKGASFQLESGSNIDKNDKKSLIDNKIIGYELSGTVSNLDENNLIKKFQALIDTFVLTSSDPQVSKKINFVMNDLELQNNKPYTLFMQIDDSTYCAVEIKVEMLEPGKSPTINPN